jgi:hypothetical protein
MATYAIQVTGRSTVGSLIDFPGYGYIYELHGGHASLVGQVTIAADGTMAGTFWGIYVTTPIPPIPYSGRISVNPDCTGESSESEGGGIEKLVVLNNGQEIRAITWAGEGTNTHTYYRISPVNGRGPSCGQQTHRGTYMERCEGFSFDASGGVATSTSLMVYSARDGVVNGTYSGKVYGFPPDYTLTESGLSGTYTVNPDCSIDKVLTLDFLPSPYTIKARGVLFDEGKQGVGLPMGIYAGNTFAVPVGPLTCQTVRLGK